MEPADPPVPPSPVDPRGTWSLPAVGTMPSVEDLDAHVTRVLAPNPSPMTLDGTNTYVVGVPGTGEVVVVDPGPVTGGPGSGDADLGPHQERVAEVVAHRDARVRAVLVTHHHPDHAAAAAAWGARFGAPVAAADARVAGPQGRVLRDGDVVALAGLGIRTVATPGHTRDHLAFRLGSGVLLCGDHVLGRGTSVVAHPDGDLVAYLASLRRCRDLGRHDLYPGHGPALTEDPTAVLDYYAAHRRFRQEQLVAAVAAGCSRPAELVARVYAEVDRRLWPAAEASTRAALDALVADGRLRHLAGDRVALAPT